MAYSLSSGYHSMILLSLSLRAYFLMLSHPLISLHSSTMFHREYLVVFVAHVAQAKVCGRAIRGCGQHHLHYYSRDV